MLGRLLSPADATVSNLICTRGGQHADWSADYRLYSKDRVDEDVLFGRVRDTLLENLAEGEPLVVGIDDTIVRKTGKAIHGSGWKRDPLGPAFQTNLVRAQRYLQFSAAWPLENGAARMVPIDFLHTPTPIALIALRNLGRSSETGDFLPLRDQGSARHERAETLAQSPRHPLRNRLAKQPARFARINRFSRPKNRAKLQLPACRDRLIR
jgi:hypothetical protein